MMVAAVAVVVMVVVVVADTESLSSILFLRCVCLNLYGTIGITKTRLFKYIEILPPKTENFQMKKKLRYFPHFCSKHRLWVLVRTASVRRF